MPQHKLTTRQIQAQKTKKKLYKISIDLMKKHGYDNVTIEDISKKAGLSVGAFYHYYSSKSDILNEIYKEGDDYFESYVAHHLPEGSSADRIISFFVYYAKFNMGNGVEFIKCLYNTHNKLFIKKGRFMQVLLQHLVEEGQHNGEIAAASDSEEITAFLFIMIRGVIYDWCLHDGSYDLAEAVEKSISQILKTFQTGNTQTN